MILAFTGTLLHLVSGGVGVLYVIAFVCITMPSLTVLFCYISELFTVQCTWALKYFSFLNITQLKVKS